MSLTRTDIIENKKIEISLLNLAVILYLFRMAIPFLKFPFILLYCCLMIYSLIKYRAKIIENLNHFFSNFGLPIVLGFVLFMSFLFSDKIYLAIFKDVFNMLILLTLFFFGTFFVEGKKELRFLVANLTVIVICFGVIISVITILDTLCIYSYDNLSFYNLFGNNTSSAAITIDNNFALLPVLFGMISIFYLMKHDTSKLKKTFFNIVLIIFSLNIILAGSRRGIILLVLIYFILVSTKIVLLFANNRFLQIINFDSIIYIMSLTTLLILLNIFFLHTSYGFKNKTLNYLGSKNIVLAKYRVAYNLFRCISVMNNKLTFAEFNDKIWKNSFIPEDPDSGWGSRYHKTVFPLKGKNVEMIPKNAKGYLMDNTCNASYYPGDDISESFSVLVNLNTAKGDHYIASVFCFVSDSVDVDFVSIGVPDAIIYSNIVSGVANDHYNLNNKNIWQKLSIDFTSTGSNIPILLSFWKRGVKDFSSIKGFIIFAYPTFEKLNSSDSVIYENSSVELNRSDLIEKHSGVYQNSFSAIYTELVPKYYSSGICNLPLSYLIKSIFQPKDNDPVRSLANRFISEDTTYHSYKSEIILDTVSSQFIAERLSRWEFALKIYSKEFSLRQKIFGGGFNFLNWFGYYFDKDKTRSDYPHNPFLSVLLYSGIVGLIIYLFFMYKVFYYYYKYFNEYKILAIFFLITFFFSFFSAGSPFDPPIMGFFNILPFFIHAVHKRSAEHRAEGKEEERSADRRH